MTRWTYAQRPEVCGFDGGPIRTGMPMQVLSLPGLPVRLRCADHAHGPIDHQQLEREAMADAAPPAPPPPPRFVRAGAVALPFDPRRAAANDRDDD